MAKYRVWSGGDGTGGADNTDWSQAYQTLAAAIAAPPGTGDDILIHYAHQETSVANVTWTLPASVDIHCVNKDSSEATTAMGTSGWIGGDSNFFHTLTSGTDSSHHITGLTIRVGGASDRDIVIGSSAANGCQWDMEDCYFWCGNTSTSTHIQLGDENTSQFFSLSRCTFRFGSTSQGIDIRARIEAESCDIASAGSAPASFLMAKIADLRGFDVQWSGGDLSHAGSGNLVSEVIAQVRGRAIFRRCKLGSGYVMLSSSATLNSGLEVLVLDSASTDSHIHLGHQNALGSTVIDTGIYVTADAEALSWKIVTSANALLSAPYCTPWIRKYNDDVSTAIQPWLEILRDGSATAYDDDEVWGVWSYKGTTGSTQATIVDDRMVVLGTPAAQAAGTGTGNWTGENATAWSGKVQAPASFTPAEIGDIRARICVGLASATVYVSPRIRV